MRTPAANRIIHRLTCGVVPALLTEGWVSVTVIYDRRAKVVPTIAMDEAGERFEFRCAVHVCWPAVAGSLGLRAWPLRR